MAGSEPDPDLPDIKFVEAGNRQRKEALRCRQIDFSSHFLPQKPPTGELTTLLPLWPPVSPLRPPIFHDSNPQTGVTEAFDGNSLRGRLLLYSSIQPPGVPRPGLSDSDSVTQVCCPFSPVLKKAIIKNGCPGKKKAAFRAKLNAQKQEKQRIDSPLVRYNEHDQLVCRVCDVVVKSESLWPAHQASRKHHEAINNLKANAAALNQANNSKPMPSKELPKKSETSTVFPAPRSSSSLPSDFFDNHEAKKQKNERNSGKLGHPDIHTKNDLISGNTQVAEPYVLGSETDGPSIKSVETRDSEIQASEETRQVSKVAVKSEAKQIKGALPEGFFDDKDSDLRARGITPVKPDVKDEYKEFEKLIQEDLKEIDNRLEEEEFDAAETIEEEESVEQRTYRERVEMLRKKKLEIRAARSVISSKGTEVAQEESSPEESSSDDDNDDVLPVDWRAKHL